MKTPRTESIWLDYGEAARDPALLTNLSAVAFAGDHLWTASDEGRTVECLAPHRDGYRLCRQVDLDQVFDGLPGQKTSDEADIESIDAIDGRLWISGSHCRVRRQLKKTNNDRVEARLRARPSRRLLGSAALADDGGQLISAGAALPFDGKGSLRHLLAHNPYIEPFSRLPSKENGIDIEGIVVTQRSLLVGLRGPLVDSIALVADLKIARGATLKSDAAVLHFLDLDGLGVRDLARWNDDVAILAGPVTGADGPFRIYKWTPQRTERVQKPQMAYPWPESAEHPEGFCRMRLKSAHGFLVVFDSPALRRRIHGTRYRADWIGLA